MREIAPSGTDRHPRDIETTSFGSGGVSMGGPRMQERKLIERCKRQRQANATTTEKAPKGGPENV
jgi:hypothetical protein